MNLRIYLSIQATASSQVRSNIVCYRIGFVSSQSLLQLYACRLIIHRPNSTTLPVYTKKTYPPHKLHGPASWSRDHDLTVTGGMFLSRLIDTCQYHASMHILTVQAVRDTDFT